MSYDVSLTINTGKADHEVVDCGNYTYNVSPMYRKAFPLATKGIQLGINCLHDMRADAAAEILNVAIDAMVQNKEEYIALNPSNGWGNYDGALSFLCNIRSLCLIHPLCTVKIS
jgi:hypothetical protein